MERLTGLNVGYWLKDYWSPFNFSFFKIINLSLIVGNCIKVVE